MPDRPATLRDVAAAARVHPATASRALNPETRILVSEDTARRVTDAAARLGYRPNPVARSLRTRRSHTVGVLIPDLNNPLFPPIVRGLEDRLAAAGYVALLGNTDGTAAKSRSSSGRCGPATWTASTRDVSGRPGHPPLPVLPADPSAPR